MKLSDRKTLLKTRGKSRGPTTASTAPMSGETPKKVTSAEGDCFLCKDKIPSPKEKVKIFGKS